MPMLDADTPRIALFRARDDAAQTAARLNRLGFTVASLPAFDVVPLPVAPKRPRYGAMLATSAHAFLADFPIDRSTPLFVAGARTGDAAERRGFRLAAPPARDSKALAEGIVSVLPAGADLLYVAGRNRKPALETALGGAYALEVVEAYVAEARTSWGVEEVCALQGSAAALHFSRRSAALAAALSEAGGVGEAFRAMIHICLSDDVAAPLKAAGVGIVQVAEKPDEAALVAALIAVQPVFSSRSRSRI
jgi:uroporphyrinogen-III synthase